MKSSLRILACVVCGVLFSSSSFGFYQMDDTVFIQDKLNEAKLRSDESQNFEWAELTEKADYHISGTLLMPPNVGLRGTGMGGTTIYSLPSLRTNQSIRFIDAENAQLMDLCLNPQGTQKRVIEMTRSPNVKMTRVRLEEYHEPIATHNDNMFAVLISDACHGIEIVNCEFLNMSMESDISCNSLRALNFGRGDGYGIMDAVVRDCLFENIYAIGAIFEAGARNADAIVTAYTGAGAFIEVEGNTFINAGKRAVKDQSGGMNIINNTMIFEDEFYDANDGLGRIGDPSEAIGLQVLNNTNISSFIAGNIIYGNFINAAIRVGDRDVTFIRDNIINVPSSLPDLDIRPWPDRDGIQVRGRNTNILNVFNCSFVGDFRHGINKYDPVRVSLVNTRFFGVREDIIHDP